MPDAGATLPDGERDHASCDRQGLAREDRGPEAAAGRGHHARRDGDLRLRSGLRFRLDSLGRRRSLEGGRLCSRYPGEPRQPLQALQEARLPNVGACIARRVLHHSLSGAGGGASTTMPGPCGGAVARFHQARAGKRHRSPGRATVGANRPANGRNRAPRPSGWRVADREVSAASGPPRHIDPVRRSQQSRGVDGRPVAKIVPPAERIPYRRFLRTLRHL